MMLYQRKFIHCNKGTTLVGGVHRGGGCACVGPGGYGNALYLPLDFVVNLKLLFLKVLIKIITDTL